LLEIKLFKKIWKEEEAVKQQKEQVDKSLLIKAQEKFS